MSTAAPSGLVIVQPGLSTTVQDRGRFGWQRFGVPVSGALDATALAAANIVAGNEPGEAVLECLYQGCEVEVAADSARFAVAGSGAWLDLIDPDGSVERRVVALESVVVTRGHRVRVRIAGPSISAYLAVAGGMVVAPVMGSRSTYVRARLGGHDGRALREGDHLRLARGIAAVRGEVRLEGIDLAPASVVRIVAGPQDDHFSEQAMAVLCAAPYVVRPASDRMGLRLDGAKLEHRHGADIVSDGIAPGAIQVPGDGLPIVMLADRQTTGGYTKIATVISADLPALGRVGPGSVVRFELVSIEEAEAAARCRASEIAGWLGRLVPAVAGAGDALNKLYDANLISGVVDGAVCGGQWMLED